MTKYCFKNGVEIRKGNVFWNYCYGEDLPSVVNQLTVMEVRDNFLVYQRSNGQIASSVIIDYELGGSTDFTKYCYGKEMGPPPKRKSGFGKFIVEHGL